MNLTKTLLAAGAIAIFGGAAFAATVNPDTWIGSADLENSGEATELAGLCVILGIEPGDCSSILMVDNKFESGLTILQDDVDEDVFYVDIAPDMPGWFVLKFGDGNTDGDSHQYFENVANLSILAWDINDIPAALWDCVEFNEVGDNCRLSHITTFIPIPAAGWLLFGGLGGLLVLRRRKS